MNMPYNLFHSVPLISESENRAAEKILFVDDERHIIEAIQRAFRGKLNIHVADSADQGIMQINTNGPFAVVVSDFQMPDVDGISFLAKVSEISPDTVRMMLTGYANLETSIRAVNEGNVFRFLTKPCPIKILERTLLDGLRQYGLIRAERSFYALKKWTQNLGGLIQAFVKLMESKDPYTAGHQYRVSLFSAAIAEAMGLSGDAVEQIGMTAMIHDVGKIYVPVEFLNKPGSLSLPEWNIVKMHAQIGCDILKPIGFPFPIHEIILQHHERGDGSGYPRGLKASEICVEAKIISVADVVEAMAHHRPYRPAKGLEEAIQELRDNRDVKYDSRVSDIACALLTEKRFQFQ
jgi:putative two-component system response regulator